MKLVSKQDAKQLGLDRYYTGKPCRRGHISERNVSNSVCALCEKENNQAYYKANRRVLIDRQRDRYANNKDLAKEWWASYYEKNKDRISAQHRRRIKENRPAISERRRVLYYLHHDKNLHRSQVYRDANKPARLAQNSKRRAMERNAVPAWYGELDAFVWKEAAALVVQRRAATGIEWNADHSIALAAKEACGLHVAENCQVIPASLNSRKRAKLVLTEPGEWIKHL